MRRLARPVMYAGVAAVVLGLSEYHARYIGGYDFASSFRFSWAVGFIVLMCLAAYGLGLPELPRTTRTRAAVSVTAPALAAIGMSIVQLFVGDALLPRFVVFSSAIFLAPWFYVCTALAVRGRSALEQRDRVVVVGPEGLARELSAELAADPERPAVVVAQVDESAAAGVTDRRRPLVDLVVSARATVVLLSAAAQADQRIVDQAGAVHEAGVRVRTQSLFYEEWLGKLPLDDLGRVSLFFDIGAVHREQYVRFKRVLDVIAGVVGVAALVVAVPVVVVGNLLANRGPIFYVQDRVGRRGAVFPMIKFRTMRQDPTGPTAWTTENDPRVTPFGDFLRRTHLDELPQALNILRGDLSLVGPRPEQPRYVAELVEKLPYYDLRHIIRPGLTGWAQVKYGYAKDERDALEKLQFEFFYLRRQSVMLDLRIIGRTLRSVLQRRGT